MGMFTVVIIETNYKREAYDYDKCGQSMLSIRKLTLPIMDFVQTEILPQ